MQTFNIIKDGKSYGYVFGEDINDAVSKAKWTLPWVTHKHLRRVQYRRT